MLTIGLYFLLWVSLTVLAPVWIVVTFVIGSFRRRRFVILRLMMFLWAFLTIEMIGLILAGFVCLFTRGDVQRRQELFFGLQCWWGATLFAWASRFLSLRVSIDGDEAVLPGPVLVFIRHASIVDTAIPVTFLSNARGLRLRYVLKRELLVDPCIDVAGHVSPNYFIDRAGSIKEELSGIRGLATDLGEEGVLLYPEGTRFSERKKRIALRQLARTHPELVDLAASFDHCLPPKLGGALTLLDAAPHADVLIVAHRGLEGLAEVRDLLSGSIVGKSVDVRIWRVPATEIPSGGQRRQWLFDWWKRVDEFVGAAHR